LTYVYLRRESVDRFLSGKGRIGVYGGGGVFLMACGSCHKDPHWQGEEIGGRKSPREKRTKCHTEVQPSRAFKDKGRTPGPD